MMKLKLTKVLKTYVAVVLVSAFLIGGIASAADDSSTKISFRNITVSRGSTSLVQNKASKAKENADAEITLNTAVSNNDQISAYLVNISGTIASKESAEFRGTASGTTKKIPYRSGAGVKGDWFRVVISLSQSSLSAQVTVDGSFAP